MSSPLGKQLGSLITRLSRSNLRERKLSDRDSPSAIEEEVYPPSEVNDEKADPKKKEYDAAAKKEMSAKEKPGWSYRLTRPFMKEDLTTPDYERGF
jgi:hypothetical protein